MNTFDDIAMEIILRLGWTSAQAVLMVGLLAVVGRFGPRLPASVRCHLWWLAGLQLLLGLCLPVPVELAWLSAPEAAANLTTLVLPPSAASPVPVLPSVDTAPWSWALALACAWLATVVWQLGRLAVGSLAMRKTIASCQPVRDDETLALANRAASAIGLSRVPTLRTGPAIDAPCVVGGLMTGAWRPVVLLPPPGMLSATELAMTLGHEFAHVRRADLWLGWIPELARRLFFFHPMAHLAVAEYALSREAACDARVVDADAAPEGYARLLLRLGVSRTPVAGLGTASTTYKNLKRRLLMLQDTASRPARRTLGWSIVVVIAATLVLPYRVTARTADPSTTLEPMPAPALAQETPVAGPMPAMEVATAAHVLVATTAAPSPEHASAVAPAGIVPAQVPPSPPVPPPAPPAPPLAAPPAPPPAPPAPPVGSMGHNYARFTVDSHSPATAYAVFDHGFAIASGDQSDIRNAERVRGKGEPVAWMRRDDKTYVSHDPKVVASISDALAPMRELGNRQEALGEEQSQLGAQQARLGAEQAHLGKLQAELSIHGQPDPAKLKELGMQQKALAERQRPLSEQQGVLGQKQARLGQQERDARLKAQDRVQQAIDAAIHSGAARSAD